MIICISIGAFYGFLVLNLSISESSDILNMMLCVICPLVFIIGIMFFVDTRKKMKNLKYLLENGIHTKAVITKSYPPLDKEDKSLKQEESIKQEDKSIESEDESIESEDELLKQENKSIEPKEEIISSIFSQIIQYQFQNKSGQTITIDEGMENKAFKYLCVGSKIHILYDPNDEKKALICPWWDEWIANNELDKYPRFVTDVATSPIVGKQRHIPFFHFFSISMFIQILVALSIIAICFILHTFQNPFWKTIFPNIQESLGNVPTWICFIGYGIGFLLFAIVYFTMKKKQNFFEYAVRTVALVQSARLGKHIKEEHNTGSHKKVDTMVTIVYQFLSSTEDNVYQGLCRLEGTPENRQLQQGSEIEIVYHAQRPNQNRPFIPEYEKYFYYNE